MEIEGMMNYYKTLEEDLKCDIKDLEEEKNFYERKISSIEKKIKRKENLRCETEINLMLLNRELENSPRKIGRILKVIRIREGGDLYNMACNFGISTPELSQIENNKAAIPADLLEKIKKYYKITDIEEKEIEILIKNSEKEEMW